MNRLVAIVKVMVIAVAMIVGVASELYAQGGAARVTADRTSLRDKAAAEGAVVTTVARGEELQIVEVSGAWFKVRTASGREGFVHSLFVERVGASAPATPAPQPQPPAPQPGVGTGTQTQAQTAQPVSFSGNTTPTVNRRLGVGLANIGPSVRYWMDGKKGLQVDAYFSSTLGYSVTAISPSFILRFKEPKGNATATFLPYAGGGVTFWRFDDGYGNYYCGQSIDCSSSTLGFGGFVGSEVVFSAVPKLGISGQAGFYSSSYGYGGFGIGLGVHYYFGAK